MSAFILLSGVNEVAKRQTTEAKTTEAKTTEAKTTEAKMQIIMKTLDAGPEGVREIGKTYEVDADEAEALVKGGYAVFAKKDVAADDGKAKADNGAGQGTADDGGND
jgi:hypothetical protein